MRELIRFGDDFHETCSIRSKLFKTKLISKQLEDLLQKNTSILTHEKKVLGVFAENRKNLIIGHENV